MNILGIDYGLSKVGVAISVDSPLAEPMATLERKNDRELIMGLGVLVDRHSIDLVVVGHPRGKIAETVENFVKLLRSAIKVKVELVDEEYSSKQAQFQARQAGKKKGRIKHKEHEWAASVILQGYLDTHV